MQSNLKRYVATGALALTLVGGTGAGVAAQQGGPGQAGGAAGLVAAVVQVATDDVVTVNVVDSFNNLRALNNVLNNSPILSENDVDVTVGDITILEDVDAVILALQARDLTLDDVVAIGVLESGEIIAFV